MLKWIATNGPGGGFWEETPGYTPEQTSMMSQEQQQIKQIQSQPPAQSTFDYRNNPFYEGALNQGNTAAAESIKKVSDTLSAANKSGVDLTNVNAWSPIIQAINSANEPIGENLSQNQLTAVQKKQKADEEYKQAMVSGLYEKELKDIEAWSKQTGLPMSQRLSETAKKAMPTWSELNKDYVSTVNPYEADKESWISKNIGGNAALIGAIATPFVGPFAGLGLASAASATKGGFNGIRENLVKNVVSTYGTDLLNKWGTFGKELQANRFGTPGATATTTPATSGNQIFKQTFLEPDIAQGSALEGLAGTATSTPANPWNLNIPSINPSEFMDYSTASADDFIKDYTSKNITPVEELKERVVNDKVLPEPVKKSVFDLLKSGNIPAALQGIASTTTGKALLTGLAQKFLGLTAGETPTQTPVNTYGLDLTAEFIKRMDPKYYAMTQEEKDYLFNTAYDKISAVLAQRGVSRSSPAIKASQDLIKQIEIEDMTNQRNFANKAWLNFVDYVGGRENIARQNYLSELKDFQDRQQTLNNRVANLIEIVAPETTYQSILNQTPKYFG